MRDKASVNVLVHHLVYLPTLAAVNSIYQALGRFHSLDSLLHLLVTYLILGLDDMNEFEVFLRHHLMLLLFLGLTSLLKFASSFLDTGAQEHIVECLVYEVDLKLAVADL